MTKWKTMDSAPKKGIYLAARKKTIGVGSWDGALLEKQHWAVDRWGNDFTPTHWKLLPKPPK